MTAHTRPPMRVGGMTSKLHDHHVRRLAIVYVRQSLRTTSSSTSNPRHGNTPSWTVRSPGDGRVRAWSALMQIRAKAARVW